LRTVIAAGVVTGALVASSQLSHAALPSGLDISTVRGAALIADQGSQPGTGVTALGGTSTTVNHVSYSGIIHWVPSYALFNNLSVKAQLGEALLKTSATSTFGLADYEGLLSYYGYSCYFLSGLNTDEGRLGYE